MASESTKASVNGNYGSQQSYNLADQHHPSQASLTTTSATPNGLSSTPSTNPTNTMVSSTAESNNNVPKDEVGWYFVEQYYTTLSRSPEKLHLFYSKRSQFVSGLEAQKVSVSVGQRAINERIKELDIQDCKVRVLNVDSQESFKNIVVQVIGEMSNKAAPHRKFVQTFILAEQPNGYFVLNDIFRYLNEEEIEEDPTPEAPTPAPAQGDSELKTLTSSDDPAEQQHDAEAVDKKLEEKALGIETSSDEATIETPATNGIDLPEGIEVEHAEDAPLAAEHPHDDNPDHPEEKSGEGSSIDEMQLEKPRDPDPTPVASPPKPAKAVPTEPSTPAAPPKPAAPKTWANLVAANRAASPAIPGSVSSTPPAPSQPKAIPPATAPPPPAATPAALASDDTTDQTQQISSAGWQTAGQDNSKRQGRQQSISGSPDKDNVLGYVKNVTEKVDASLLKSALLQYGKLAYFDVSRQKNCAFVEFSDAAGYNAAVAANPHSIGGEQIYVEERRPRPTAYGGGFNGRGGMRGGRGGPDNRPGGQGRGGFQKEGGRGNFTPRGRGGNLTPRGRGQPQAA